MKRLLTAIPLATFAGATLFGGLLASMGTASAQTYDHRDNGRQADHQDNRRDNNRRDDNSRRDDNRHYDGYRVDDHRDDYRQADHRRWVAAHWENRGYDRVYVPGAWLDVNLNF